MPLAKRGATGVEEELKGWAEFVNNLPDPARKLVFEGVFHDPSHPAYRFGPPPIDLTLPDDGPLPRGYDEKTWVSDPYWFDSELDISISKTVKFQPIGSFAWFRWNNEDGEWEVLFDDLLFLAREEHSED